MNRFKSNFSAAVLLLAFSLLLSITAINASAQSLDQYKYTGDFDPAENQVITKGQFNGYTNYWHDVFWKWHSYGNLYQIGASDEVLSIAQSKLDIAEELGIIGLTMQEGFLNGLLAKPYRTIEQPSLKTLEESLGGGNCLVFLDPSTAAGQKVYDKLPVDDSRKMKLKSHQFNAGHYHGVDACYLENGDNTLFVVSSVCSKCRAHVKELIGSVEKILNSYDLHRGWFGAGTLLYSVTCYKGHPLEVIGKGMNQGNSWFVFGGYMDYLTQHQLPDWLAKVNLPIATDVGTGMVWGCENYDGLMLQDTPTEEAWVNFAKERGGYIFRQVYRPGPNLFNYDGYYASEGNKKQIDNEEIPFILPTGYVRENAPPCMVLFVDKGTKLTKEKMWETILSRKEVGVLPEGKMMGPKLYRNALQMLLLDRVYLEEYYGDRIHLEAEVQGQELIVNVTNTYSKSVSGDLNITVAPELNLRGSSSTRMVLPAKSSRTIKFEVQPTLSAMDKTNPIAVQFKWDSRQKSTLTIMDLPRAISVHQLLYGHAPHVTYPVTIHNFSNRTTYPVQLQVLEMNNPSRVVYEATQQASAVPGTFQTSTFTLQVPAGQYNVKVSALGAENISQLGVGNGGGSPQVYEIDLNGDGVNEYRMENDKVQITLLRTGARVIEYIVKERNDNIFFKLWPEKEITEKRPFRERGFYPYGGFEDFLGQGSMETHWVYDGEVIQSEGEYVRVRMVTDFYGNELEKIFTLYANSPLLEVRFALTFKNPEANMLGPQPILELGEKHWTEDIFTLPSVDGLVEFRMKPERAYGRVIDMEEGWNAGYDPKEDVTFVGAYPVNEPEFMHMFMNHPINSESHHYYVEFQPWIRIYQKSTMYFSYYIWGAAGPWENGVKALRERNLITKR